MLSSTVKISIIAYLVSLFNILFCFTNGVTLPIISLQIVFNICLLRLLSFEHFQYAIRAGFLGAVLAVGLLILVVNPDIRGFGLYTMIMSVFHFSEFLSIGLINPESLNLDSFLLNHSVSYGVAALLSWIEFWSRYYFFGAIEYSLLSYLGVAICIIGEIIRKASMFTARASFDHIVQMQKPEGHKLVTHGVYGIWRHPSYVGWFWWSIGTQIILLNPICCIGYAFASWNFFNARILVEELTLIKFYGNEYIKYQKRVPTGLPYIKGYVISS